MISEIEIETEQSPQKIKKKTQEEIMWFLVMLTFYDTDRKTVKERSKSRVCIYKFQRTRKCNKFSHAYYYLFGNKGAGIFTRGSRL